MNDNFLDLADSIDALGLLGAGVGTPVVIGRLVELTHSNGKGVRYSAAEALRNIGTVAATPKEEFAYTDELAAEELREIAKKRDLRK